MADVALATKERRQLAECEGIIRDGLGTFVDVGRALMAIRDDRLYRESHETFEAYCRDRWDMTKGRANQLTRGAALVMDTNVSIPTEGVARELAPLRSDRAMVAEAWRRATEQAERPTAAIVKEVVASMRAPSEPAPTRAKRTRTPKTRPKDAEAEHRHDERQRIRLSLGHIVEVLTDATMPDAVAIAADLNDGHTHIDPFAVQRAARWLLAFAKAWSQETAIATSKRGSHGPSPS